MILNNEDYMTEKNIHLDTEKRPKRVALHRQSVLSAEQRPGFIRRWVNEEAGRVERFMKAGWKPVGGEEANTSGKLAQTESQLGSIVRKVVNKDRDANCRTAILMEIHEDLYNSDQLEKLKVPDRIEASYNRAAGSDYGSFENK